MDGWTDGWMDGYTCTGVQTNFLTTSQKHQNLYIHLSMSPNSKTLIAQQKIYQPGVSQAGVSLHPANTHTQMYTHLCLMDKCVNLFLYLVSP